MKYCCDELKRNIGYSVGLEEGAFYIGSYPEAVKLCFCPFCGKKLESGI